MQQISRREEKVEPLMSRRRRQVRRNERSSGSLCLAAARDSKNAPGNKTRDESAREMTVEGPRPETSGSRSKAETIGETWRFPAICQASRFILFIPILLAVCYLVSAVSDALLDSTGIRYRVPGISLAVLLPVPDLMACRWLFLLAPNMLVPVCWYAAGCPLPAPDIWYYSSNWQYPTHCHTG